MVVNVIEFTAIIKRTGFEVRINLEVVRVDTITVAWAIVISKFEGIIIKDSSWGVSFTIRGIEFVIIIVST